MKHKIKNLPVIKWIKGGIPPDAILVESGNPAYNYNSTRVVKSVFDQMRAMLPNPPIKYMTEPFSKAMFAAQDYIMKDEIWNTEFVDGGVLVVEDFVFYYIVQDKSTGIHEYIFFCFKKNGTFLCIRQQTKDEQRSYYNKMLGSKTDKTVKEILDGLYSCLTGSLLFIKFAKVEEVVVNPKEKIHFQKCRYFNDSDSAITIYNSTWFTNITTSEGFGVRGHFRMQPYKDKKEIIWIKDYKKSGYTSKAKILSSDDA